MASSDSLGVPFWDLVGLIGATVYVGAYILSALDTLPSQSWQYCALKLVAAFLVLGSLLAGSFNLTSAVIQVFFIAVSLLGLGLHWGRKQRARACARARKTLNLAPLVPDERASEIDPPIRSAAE